MEESQARPSVLQQLSEPGTASAGAALAWASLLEDVAHPAALLDESGRVWQANALFAQRCALERELEPWDIQGHLLSQVWPSLWQELKSGLRSRGSEPLVVDWPSVVEAEQATLYAIESGQAQRLRWLVLRPRAGEQGLLGVPEHERLQVLEGSSPTSGAEALDHEQLLEALRNERAQAQESQRRYRFLSESIPQIVWLAEPDGSISYLNGRGITYFGADPAKFDGSRWAHFVHPEDAEQAQESWRQALVTCSPFEVRYRLRSRDGLYRWFLGLGLPLLDEDGRVQQWAGTCTDIDTPKRAEESLRLLADAGEILTSSLDEVRPLQTLAERLVLRFADWCFFERVLPQGRLELLAVAHADPSKIALLQEMRRHAVEENSLPDLTRIIRTAQPEMLPSISEEMLSRIAIDDRHLKYLQQVGCSSLLYVPLIARGHVLGVLTLVRGAGCNDSPEPKGSNRAFESRDLELAQEVARRAAGSMDNALLYYQAQSALQAAEEAGRVKDAFLATVSHELRTPLTTILGWANLLKSGRVDEEMVLSALETIERNVKAQAQIVEDLLDVSRIVAGNLRLEMRPVELASVVTGAIEAARPAIDARGIELDFRFPTSNPPLIAGDPLRLQQVVWNILSNATKFTPRGGRIGVYVEQHGAQVSLAVSDSGPGVPAEFAPHVFERFHQADSSLTRRHGGLGLGLAIVRHLVEMHGGSVHLEPPLEGQGATFVVELPLLSLVEPPQAPQAAQAAREDDYATRMLQGKRVLVVEDEADSRELLRIVLSRFGALVTVASDARQAWQELELEKPDVLVSDIGMPGEDGYSLIRRVRSRFTPEQLPAIALTAYAAASDREQALQAGFNTHITKPAAPIFLAMTVAGLLESR